jgi:Flp pilus assembly protein TadB
VIVPLLLGGSLGIGVWLISRGAIATAPPLRTEIERFHLPPVEEGGLWQRQAARLLATPLRPRSLDPDLAIVGTPIERHLLDKLALSIVLASCPILIVVLTGATGVGLPTGLVLVGTVVGLVVGFLLPDVLVRSRATDHRREFRAALSAYVNVVTIVLAGGGGLETALDAASSSSPSWPFQRLRAVLAQSRMSGEAAWDALDRLGRDLQVPELREVAASITLAGDSGARVRQSLDAKAASMREHDLAAARAEAESQSELMALPTVAMLLAFVLLIGYPALANVLAL